MDEGWDMRRLERDLTLIAVGVVAVASGVGAVVGWLGHRLFTRFHREQMGQS